MAGKEVSSPPSIRDLRLKELFSSSTMIPFCDTPASNSLFQWFQGWSQSCPSCLLFGPVGSGKTRLIEHVAVKIGAYVIELDCASITGIRELIQTAEESTQSHAVGIFGDTAKTDLSSISSIVVFEHFDALVRPSEPVPRAFANLLTNSRVPILITANRECLPESSFMHSIHVERPQRPFAILIGALWMRGSTGSLIARQQIMNLLEITGGDIRRTALQFQVFPAADQVIDRREKLFLSVPTIVAERENSPEWYALLTDLVATCDCDNPILDRYLRPCSQRLFSAEREQTANEYYRRTHELLQFNTDDRDAEMMVSFLYDACHNVTSVTRRRCVPPFSGKNKFSNENVQEVLAWKWWPHAARDTDCE